MDFCRGEERISNGFIVCKSLRLYFIQNIIQIGNTNISPIYFELSNLASGRRRTTWFILHSMHLMLRSIVRATEWPKRLDYFNYIFNSYFQ